MTIAEAMMVSACFIFFGVVSRRGKVSVFGAECQENYSSKFISHKFNSVFLKTIDFAVPSCTILVLANLNSCATFSVTVTVIPFLRAGIIKGKSLSFGEN